MLRVLNLPRVMGSAMLVEQGSAGLPERHHCSEWRFPLTSASVALYLLTEMLRSPQYSHVWGGTQLLLKLRTMR